MVWGMEEFFCVEDQGMPWLRSIWAFGTKIRVEMRFKRTACPAISTFPPNLDKKSQVLAFGTDLEWIWPFQIFGYLGVWAKN